MGKAVKDLAEVLTLPRQRDLSYYIVLFVAVIPLWLIVPFSWFFVIYALHSGAWAMYGWLARTLLAAAFIEVRGVVVLFFANLVDLSPQVVFSLHYYRLSKYVCRTSPLAPGNLPELQAAFRRVLKSGLTNFSEGDDEEALGDERSFSPAEDVVQLSRDDPRAMDFRNYLRIWSALVYIYGRSLSQ